MHSMKTSAILAAAIGLLNGSSPQPNRSAVALTSLRSECTLTEEHRLHWSRLWLECRGTQAVPVEGFPSLEGRVNIKSSRQALEFLRLFSSRSACDRQTSTDWVDVQKARQDGWLDLNQKEFSRLCPVPGAEEMRVKGEPMAFNAERCLLSLSSGDLYRVRQRVEQNGHVSSIEETLALKNASQRLGRCEPGIR